MVFSVQFGAQLLNARAPVVDGFVAAAAQRFVVPEGSCGGYQVGDQSGPGGAGAAAGAQLGYLGLQLLDVVVRLGQPLAKKAEITVDSLMAELEQARKLALKEGQASAAVTATMGKGKLAGLLVEKHKHSGAVGTYDLKNLSDHDLDRLEQILGPLADAGGDPSGAGEEGG